MTTKYQTQASLGIVGLLLIATPLFIKLPSQFQAFKLSTDLQAKLDKEKAQLETSEDLERARIEQKKQTAEQARKTGILPATNRLIIRDYFDNPKWNPKPNTRAFLKTEIVLVYDSAGKCIGKIQNSKWFWQHHYKHACNSIPVQ